MPQKPHLNVTIQSHDGKSFGAYYAVAEKPQAPTVLFIQEIFGVNPGLRKMCDDMADTGFHAICPDLFWRQEPNLQLSDQNDAQTQKAFDLYKGFDVALGIKDLLSTLAFARNQPGNNGKTASLGFCLGGKLAYLMAAQSDATCHVGYYGVGLEQQLDHIPHIKNPLLMHFAGDDAHVPPPVREKIFAAFKANPLIEAYVYEKVDHGFARVNGMHYNAGAANLANHRTHAFLAKHLG